MDNNNLINELFKVVLSSIDNDTLLQLVKDRGLKTTDTKPLESMDADELNHALRNVDGSVLWHALGEDDGIWDMLDDKNAYVVQTIKDDPQEYISEFSTQDLRTALHDSGDDLYAGLSSSDLLDEVETIVQKLRSKNRY
jgi:hypothetical protein